MLSIFLLEINFFPYKFILLIAAGYFFNKARQINVRTELQWQPDGQWLLKRKNRKLNVSLQANSLVTPFLTILNFISPEGHPFTLVIFKDNIDVEDFRRLRVRLKVEGLTTSTRDTIAR